jgi:hypothetical protein
LKAAAPAAPAKRRSEGAKHSSAGDEKSLNQARQPSDGSSDAGQELRGTTGIDLTMVQAGRTGNPPTFLPCCCASLFTFDFSLCRGGESSWVSTQTWEMMRSLLGSMHKATRSFRQVERKLHGILTTDLTAMRRFGRYPSHAGTEPIVSSWFKVQRHKVGMGGFVGHVLRPI